jgi:hypothetical protein
MIPKRNRKQSVKTSIPRQLYQAIIRIQADEDSDWTEAAEKAALLVDANGEKFKEAVAREADRLARSRFLKQLNKGRESIRDNAFNKGMNYVRRSEDNFRVPCSICGKPMYFSSRDENWENERTVLYEAFGNWRHTNC